MYRRLEAETNEKLTEVYSKILQAGVDKTQSERDVKLKETLSTLQRMFPGKCALNFSFRVASDP